MNHHVVVNHEEQYSVWPEGRDLPDGWRLEGFTGGREECLAHIDQVWTDLRPLSARES
ncbi:MbtH family protein [Streptosporangium carneum]|uniref:MbtH protein n=1 Tax=Streptosporangium carneum TaxID=47481 RepID=A0A9W6HZX1_9ACTN|nr:MbtH family NRPS accessory protein [Streptosporangium carneum]GLK09450.1 MbtH protein [Streptosporangium carneum]